MDLKVCGILDIVIVLVGLIFIIVGFKKGFIKKVLSLAGFLTVLILSFVYCEQFAEFLTGKEIIYPNIYDAILSKLELGIESVNLEPTSTVVDLLEAAGTPRFMAELFANALPNVEGNLETMCIEVSSYVAGLVMNAVAFFVILIGTLIAVGILKIITKCLRKVAIVRIADGILGAALYFAMFLLILFVGFTLVQLFMDQPWFADVRAFLVVDMQLPVNGEETPFRLSRYLYDYNVIYKLIEMFLIEG